jgi:hypothetical protein
VIWDICEANRCLQCLSCRERCWGCCRICVRTRYNDLRHHVARCDTSIKQAGEYDFKLNDMGS